MTPPLDWFLYCGSGVGVIFGLVHLAYSGPKEVTVYRVRGVPTVINRGPLHLRALASLTFSAAAQAIVLLGWLILRAFHS